MAAGSADGGGNGTADPHAEALDALIKAEGFPESTRFAYAYGSGAYTQAGYADATTPAERPMLDLLLCVDGTFGGLAILQQPAACHMPPATCRPPPAACYMPPTAAAAAAVAAAAAAAAAEATPPPLPP